IERLPTGQPSVRLHGRAARRAEQLGMDRIAVSISHEDEYAVAIAFGVRTTAGRFLFPPDIEERLDDRERRILARMERLRDLAGAALLVCRAAGRAGAGLVTLAVPESLQPLFAAKVVEATTMALPEDDVEEVDPEPAIARILDHDHDAIVLGPGLRPGLATT